MHVNYYISECPDISLASSESIDATIFNKSCKSRPDKMLSNDEYQEHSDTLRTCNFHGILEDRAKYFTIFIFYLFYSKYNIVCYLNLKIKSSVLVCLIVYLLLRKNVKFSATVAHYQLN